MIAEFERDTAESDPASREAEEADLKTVIRNGEFSIEQAFPLQTVADVDEVVVWGHDDPPEPTSDPYLRATQEWIAMASAVSLITSAGSPFHKLIVLFRCTCPGRQHDMALQDIQLLPLRCAI